MTLGIQDKEGIPKKVVRFVKKVRKL